MEMKNKNKKMKTKYENWENVTNENVKIEKLWKLQNVKMEKTEKCDIIYIFETKK